VPGMAERMSCTAWAWPFRESLPTTSLGGERRMSAAARSEPLPPLRRLLLLLLLLLVCCYCCSCAITHTNTFSPDDLPQLLQLLVVCGQALVAVGHGGQDDVQVLHVLLDVLDPDGTVLR
jgi:hypothetical protein